MNVTERFLHYVSFDTQSEEDSRSTPSTAKQLHLGAVLKAELEKLGLSEVKLDEYGRVYGTLPATPDCAHLPALALIAHMDTAGEESGADIHPRIVPYQGGCIALNEKCVLDPAVFPSLNDHIGKHLIVTDGTTLLGADDKAGVAEIVSAADYLTAHPELSHPTLYVVFTCDEEIGRGADHFDHDYVKAAGAYTVDGGALGELEYENFNAAHAQFVIHGTSIHPGEGKDKMVNAALILAELVNLLPAAETPAHTEGYEGFYHVCDLSGDVSSGTLSMLIRDHDRARFEARKRFLVSLVHFLNAKYGEGRVQVDIEDSYYNMKEQLLPHMELVDNAKQAFVDAGVTPRIVPIRGGTDGARLSYEGLPCPNLSTGGLNFHGCYEYLPVEDMEKMVEVLVRLVTHHD